MEKKPIPTLYGTEWCGGTRRARALLDQNHVPYLWVDIEKDEEGARKVEQVARGYRSVPTLVWPDGTALVEPSLEELTKKLGLDPR